MNNNNTRAGRDTNTFVVGRVSKVRDELMFNNYLSKLWNKLPSEIRCNNNHNLFRKDLKDYLLRVQNECGNTKIVALLVKFHIKHFFIFG